MSQAVSSDSRVTVSGCLAKLDDEASDADTTEQRGRGVETGEPAGILAGGLQRFPVHEDIEPVSADTFLNGDCLDRAAASQQPKFSFLHSVSLQK